MLNWAEISIQAAEKSSYCQANWGIWFGNLNDKTAKLSMMTFAYRSTSYIANRCKPPKSIFLEKTAGNILSTYTEDTKAT